MPMQWFRFYNGAVDDPKLRSLSDQLFRFWIDLLCVASEKEPRGQLPSVKAISLRLRRRLDHVEGGLKGLIRGGLIDASMVGLEGPLAIHNWGRFQYKSDDVTSRVQRFRNAKRNDIETPPDTDTDTDTDPEPELSVRPSTTDRTLSTLDEPVAVSTDGLTDGQINRGNLSLSGRMLARWIERYVPRTSRADLNPILGRTVGPGGTFIGAERLVRKYGAHRVLGVIREMSEEQVIHGTEYVDVYWRQGIKSPAEYLAWYLRENYG